MKRIELIKAMIAGPVAPLAMAQTGGRGGPSLERKTPPGVSATDPLLSIGCLDVTKAPYFADPSGEKDSTAAIQHAVNDARDYQYVCFFPSGTYLISDTISCEQPVQKLDKPRFTDGMRQSYWDIPSRTCVLMGSTAGKRPVLKLAAKVKGFDDPAKPKNAVYIWAQTRNDAPGKAEPEWGKEQPNISFGHTFRGIDIDVRGHAGAVGIRHTGSQGATLQDCTIYAEGAYAGMNNCPGQGGGTYNIEVLGGQYGIFAGPECRFPMLCACVFKGQTKAAVSYSSQSPPMVLVGCLLEGDGPAAIDLSTNKGLTGVSVVDCVISLNKPGPVFATGGRENLFLENCFVKGATAVHKAGSKIPKPGQWTKIDRYSWSAGNSVTCINGAITPNREIVRWSASGVAPSYSEIHSRHWSKTPSFQDKDAVSVKSFGAKGDGETDDTAAFKAAIAKHDKVFVPRGAYRISAPLALGAKTALFGLHRSFSTLRFGDPGADSDAAVITMPDDARANTSLTFLSIAGLIQWTAGRGLLVMAPARLRITGNGGGRFCGVTGIHQGFRVEGTKEPIAFYALNVERIRTNPQSEIRNARNVRIYFLKVEATPTGYGVGVAEGTGNTPLAIVNSRDVRVYCVNGNVVTAEKRPMVDVINSEQILISHAKSFKTGDFSQVREVRGKAVIEVPSDRASALLVRD
jgi:hypothetical protein